MHLLKKAFLELDLFSALPTLRARGEPNTMNLCGGIVSFIILIICTYVFINFVNTITNKVIKVE